MRRIFDHSAIPAAVLLILTIGFLIIARNYALQSRMMPLIIGRTMLVLCTLDLISRSHTAFGRALLRWLNPAGTTDVAERGEIEGRREMFYITWVAAFSAGLIWVGVYLAVPIFLFTSIAIVGKRGLIESILVTAVISGLVWSLFSLALHLQLFPGRLFGGQW